MLNQRANQIFELLLRLEIAAPAAQVDTAEHNFTIARRDQRIGFFNQAIELHRAALASNAGNNAERAAIVASILNFQIRTRSFGDGFTREDRSRDQLSMGKDVAYQSEGGRGERYGFQRDKILLLLRPVGFMIIKPMIAKPMIAKPMIAGMFLMDLSFQLCF